MKLKNELNNRRAEERGKGWSRCHKLRLTLNVACTIVVQIPTISGTLNFLLFMPSDERTFT